MPPQGRGIVKPPMTLAEFVTMQERGKAPPKGPAIQPEMSLLAWLAQKGEALGQALGTYDPWALAMPLEAPAKKVASKAASTLADFVKPITAYHASPHDFEKFDIRKVGTGQGAQSYGHGIYAAESPAVSGRGGEYDREFTEMLRRTKPITFAGGEAIPGTLEHRMLVDIDELGREAAISRWEKNIASNVNYAPDQANLQRSVLDKVKQIDPQSIKAPRATIYDIGIHASPDDFLDWDKPLSQQSEKVRKALGDKFGNVKPVKLPSGGYGLTRVSPDGSGKVIVGIQAETPEAAMSQLTGERAYQIMASKWDATSKSDAADNLKGLGIKGVRYLDQGSRGMVGGVDKLGDKWFVKGSMTPHATKEAAEAAAQSAGNRTSNYVVFDDSIIDIRKKMALLLGLGGSSAAATQLPQRKPQ